MTPKVGEVSMLDLGYEGKARPIVIMSREDSLAPRALSVFVPPTDLKRFAKSMFSVILRRKPMNMDKQISNAKNLNRRGFLKASGLTAGSAGLAALTGVSESRAAEVWPPAHPLIWDGDTVLFQGDSITDMGRNHQKGATPNDQAGIGTGYAWLAAAELLVDRPKAGLKIFNRGISGNKVFQLAERWQADCLDLKPDVLSILIGVNDFWHTLNGQYNGTVAVYERDFNALLQRTRKALRGTKFIICEPFVLRCGSVNEKWFPEFDHYRAAARRVADARGAIFIPFQAMFDEAVKYAAPSHWSADGVHPTAAGASLMAHAWLNHVRA
jgi:lysophospholipase L1-like esterase